MSSSITVKYANALAKNVTITIKDYTTGDIIPGASVTVTNTAGYSWQGTSDLTGKISLTALKPARYTIIAKKTGYQDSNLDILANDYFDVE